MSERPRFADEAMALRFAALMADDGEEPCGTVMHDTDSVCLRRPHPHEPGDINPHITLIDGSPIQWIDEGIDAVNDSESNAGRVVDGRS